MPLPALALIVASSFFSSLTESTVEQRSVRNMTRLVTSFSSTTLVNMSVAVSIAAVKQVLPLAIRELMLLCKSCFLTYT